MLTIQQIQEIGLEVTAINEMIKTLRLLGGCVETLKVCHELVGDICTAMGDYSEDYESINGCVEYVWRCLTEVRQAL